MGYVMLFLVLAFAFFTIIISHDDKDFFDDVSRVLDEYHIKYNIELDDHGNKMMVIIRKDSDPFFAVTQDE